MKIPAPVERFALAMVIGVVFCILWAQTVGAGATKGPDFCAAANLRQCKVSDSGNGWVIVADSVTNTFIVELIKDGKVVQVLR